MMLHKKTTMASTPCYTTLHCYQCCIVQRFGQILSIIALALVLTTFFSSASIHAAEPPVYLLKTVDKPSSSDRLVDFSWSDGKKTVKLSELAKGKPVFLNFWATWCPPCRAELPDIVEMHKELGNKVVFIGVSLDQERTEEKSLKLVSAFMTKAKMNYVNIIGITATSDLSRPYGKIESIPTTLIIDKNGVIVERIVGSRSKAEFMAALKKVL
jgi:thiol-disulfide isomerase/thioredoxin